MKIDTETIYQHLPSFAQQLALNWRVRSLRKIWYGPLFGRYVFGQ
jgi:hypothetical protein